MRHKLIAVAMLFLLIFCRCAAWSATSTATARQQSLDEWRNLTSPPAEAPRVFVKGDVVQFFFPTEDGVEAFSARWTRLRVPTTGYRADSALLRWDQKLERLPEGARGWREATVIAGESWRRLATNLVAELTPKSPGRGYYYEAFLAGRLFYRDTQGVAHLAAAGEQPAGIVVEHRYPIEETLQVVGRVVEEHLGSSQPGDSLFLLMPPGGNRFTQPLLVDQQQRQCVFLAPAALYDYAEGGLGLTATVQGVDALVLEGHGLALLKNPISSVARLGDLAVQTLVRFIRLPLPKSGGQVPALSHSGGMDLAQWETWMDRYTGTRRENGSMRLLIDGDRFFPELQQAIAQATNHIYVNIYIFDKDDVGVGVADQLKQRSSQVKVKVIFDRLGSIAAGTVPPGTPMPENFVPPSSIGSYLKQDSAVGVRPFLNPWFSADHSKLILVDGARAWLGGMNLGREYRYEWHDMMVELEGPVVGSLEDSFGRKWAHAGLLGDLAYAAAVLSGPKNTEPSPASDRWIQVRRLPTRTAWKPFAAAVLESAARAQNYIYAENPYLFDRKVVAAMVRARLRGVDVRVVLPRVNDFKAGGRSNLITANYLLENGVRVYFYPGMTHVKALLVDDWACVGSGNLNHLSLRISQEENIATSDPGFSTQLKRQLFEEDFARSFELKEPISVEWQDVLADLVMENF
jgi:cardiolipin synthase A/B